jgi:hypothetical protein
LESYPRRGVGVKTLLASIVLVATGAVLVWGVDTSVRGISVNTIGGGLLLIGLLVASGGLVRRAARDELTRRRRDDRTVRRA